MFTHVSFQKAVVPYETYANGQQLTVTMKDKVVELAEVVVGKKNKPQKIAISGRSDMGGYINLQKGFEYQ